MESVNRIIQLQKIMWQIKKARRLNYITQLTMKLHGLATKLVVWSIGNELIQYQNLYNLTRDFRWIKFMVEVENMLMKMKGETSESIGND